MNAHFKSKIGNRIGKIGESEHRTGLLNSRSSKKAHLKMTAGRILRPKTGTPSFTLIELLVVLAIVAVLGCLLLQGMQRARQRAFRIRCTSNLIEIGLSFRTWALDNKARFPSQVLTNQWGELRPEAATNVYLHFLVMSNELATPYPLRCPADAARAAATEFGKLTNTNISYFVGLDAADKLIGNCFFAMRVY